MPAGPEPRPLTVSRRTLATFEGWLLGFAVMLVVIAVSGVVGLGWTQFPVGLGMGTGVGWLQGRVWPLLQARRPWLLATAAGITLPFLVTDAARALRPIAARVSGATPVATSSAASPAAETCQLHVSRAHRSVGGVDLLR